MLCSAGLSDTSLFKVKSAVLSGFSSSVNAKELSYPFENTQKADFAEKLLQQISI